MMKPSIAPQQIIDKIQKNIIFFSEWVGEYIYTGIYDLQEKYIREELCKWGFDYDKG